MATENGYLSYYYRYGSNTTTYGTEFSPHQDIWVYAFRAMTTEDKTGSMRIGDLNGITLTIDNVIFTRDTWTVVPLETPLKLDANGTYIVQAVIDGSYGRVGYTQNSSDVSINSKITNDGHARYGGYPGTRENNVWAAVDITFDTEAPTPPEPPTPPGSGFEIQLMNNTEELNKITKNPTLVQSLYGFLRDATNIIDPEIMIEFEGAFVTCNYMYIPVFNRYYFITDIESVRTNLWKISAHCDVLKTYSEGLLNTEAVIARNEGLYNLYLNDDMFKVYTNPRLQIAKFPNKFTGESYVLVMNGAKYT